MLRSFLASIIKFSIKLFGLKKHYFGFYKKFIKKYNLFRNVKKKIKFKKKIKLELCIDDWIQQQLYLFNTYEECELKFLENTLKPGDTFIDIGANIGLYSLTAASIVTESGKVIAFEPFPKNYEKLSKHIRINSFKNISIEKLAISDKAGTITIYINEKEQNCGMASTIEQIYTAKETIQATTLDEYLLQHPQSQLHFIKMDIEGGELKALQGMQQTLKKYSPTLLIEFDEQILTQAKLCKEDIINFLKKFNYKLYFLTTDGKLTETKIPDKKLTNNVVFKIEI